MTLTLTRVSDSDRSCALGVTKMFSSTVNAPYRVPVVFVIVSCHWLVVVIVSYISLFR